MRYALSRDPLMGVQLNLQFGIRKWIEYTCGVLVLDTILLIWIGALALQYFGRLP